MILVQYVRIDNITDLIVSSVSCGMVWLGNSERIADKHYNQVLESHFQKAVQFPVQHTPAGGRIASQDDSPVKQETPDNHVSSVKSGVSSMGDEGFEPPTSTV